MKNKFFLVFFATFFAIVSPLLQTESFIENLANLRRTYLQCKKLNTEIISVTTNYWNLLPNKNELLYNKSYYDIQKVTHSKDKTILVVVKDDFEKVIKMSLNQKSSKKVKQAKHHTFFTENEFLVNHDVVSNFIQKNKVTDKMVLQITCGFPFQEKKPPIV